MLDKVTSEYLFRTSQYSLTWEFLIDIMMIMHSSNQLGIDSANSYMPAMFKHIDKG